MTMQSLMHIQTNRDGVLNRRSFLRNLAIGSAGLSMLGWKDTVTLHAEELRKRGMACILMFMRGGPSQFETFDPKPGTTNGGPTKAISTAVSGIEVAEGWENVARAMNDITLIRSMTNREGEHQRATYQLHTGYVPVGSVKYPSLGSIVASEIGPQNFDLPHFVSIGNRVNTIGSGFLGMSVAPFVVASPTQLPANVALPRGVADKRFERRLGLLDQIENDFAEAGGGPRVTEHKSVYSNAAQMVRSPRLKAFDLNQEKDETRDRYGRTPFGQGCLLARRLVETGVTFVEIESNGWDTHQDNFDRVKTLAGQVDPAFASLVRDLKERGMLDRTLVIWMGEFGRTPKINSRGDKPGRDHFPRAFNVALAGAGIKGGQVIGGTSSDGTDVKSRPVTVPDLFCSFYQALKINPRKENMSTLGRPIKLMDKGEAVKELFA
ncbi:MAG TPA: DUF1501 domain-containing protein [Gemmataceae bacterium]|nr:DUF1501 domain-containing protein [Gemmataceae bacterium]